MGRHLDALDIFLASPQAEGWRDLPFFVDGAARLVLAEVERREAAGAHILPGPEKVFRALSFATPAAVRVVILGQDPYPTPGHAHGLAFSYAGDGGFPASLRNIFRELASDLGTQRRAADLTDWAEQGVLLLNPALTVEAGRAGAHLKLGWAELTKQILRRVGERSDACAFILWGGSAKTFRPLIDERKHLVIESAHPSPLSARHGFFGSKPFSRANEFLRARGREPVVW